MKNIIDQGDHIHTLAQLKTLVAQHLGKNRT